jgi:hypothetical protein
MRKLNIALLVGMLFLVSPKMDKKEKYPPYVPAPVGIFVPQVNSIKPINHTVQTYFNMHSLKDTNYLVEMYEDTLRGISTLISERQHDSIMKKIIAKWDTLGNSIKINQEYLWGNLIKSDTIRKIGLDR